jgi:hypothetical protein
MHSILIIAQNRGNFLGKKLLLYPTADKEAKTKQRAGEKAKKEMHHDSAHPPQQLKNINYQV